MISNNITQLTESLLAELSKEQSQLPKIKKFIADGANINYQTEKEGYTALMLAVNKNDEPLVTYLLQQGADPLIKNLNQQIASDLAMPHSIIYQQLKNYELLFATRKNDSLSAKAIIAAGANVNFQGQGGSTALLIAVEQSSIDLVELLLINGADLSISRDDGMIAIFLATNDLIYKTLDYGKPFSKEQKENLLRKEDDERWEKGRLKTLEARKGQPFTLRQLKIYPTGRHFSPAPNEAQLAELEQYFGHPLPTSLKELFIHYNGGQPKLCYFGDDEDSAIYYFYALDEKRDSVGNIWWTIGSCSEFIGLGNLPFAEDPYGGVYFLKWVKGKAQVWLFQYGDQSFDDTDNDNFDDDDKMPVCISFICDSLDELLESLYEA